MKRILNNQRISIMRLLTGSVVALSAAVLMTSCGAGGDSQGLEYAPNMYHSVAYEPYSQIVDEDAGRWLTSIDYPDGHAEFFNSNKLNQFRMNMREAPANTVSRNKHGWLPYRLGKDSLDFASRTLTNPLDSTAAVVADGKVLYEMYCDHCHGPKGAGDGKAYRHLRFEHFSCEKLTGFAQTRRVISKKCPINEIDQSCRWSYRCGINSSALQEPAFLF
jgi:mono/diheme cytochrome c family protein